MRVKKGEGRECDRALIIDVEAMPTAGFAYALFLNLFSKRYYIDDKQKQVVVTIIAHRREVY
ncbi:hypothetical protein PN499_27780 [Kamptonema animale CS-326]|jgi:hypothetical protein|uniref:hypothetical protein n=1 Tax=Kamptonema animale TaxID=92934 RepID=UPI00232FD42E|nr:hypothetical protein [Kamptonema animale]MDB9515007.1 hypothetical protein [Kamptonema animale CS-326]